MEVKHRTLLLLVGAIAQEKITFDPKSKTINRNEVNTKRQLKIELLGFLVKEVARKFEIIVPAWRPDIH